MFLLQANVSVAQWTLDVAGSVKKEETNKRFEGVTITVKRNGSVWKTLESPDNGKFDVSLPPDAIYTFEFSKAGHVTKRVEFSTKNVPPEDAKYGFEFPMEMNLFEEIDGLDVSILDKPIAKIGFNPGSGYMDYDPDYTKSIQKELDRLKKELEERKKQKEAEMKEKQKIYDAAIMAADKAYNAEKWAEAKPFYEKAAEAIPDESYPLFQLGEISDKLAATAEADKRYKSMIEGADKAFADREWDKASSAYEKASVLKDKEQYPKDKIKEIADIIKNEKKVAEEYNAAIASADAALGLKSYETAKTSYQKAAGLKSYEQYPQDKIKEIDAILAELALKDKEYNDVLAEADKLFNSKEYQKSIITYTKALGFKPEEVYPKGKIEEANKKIEELKQVEENYKKYIADADAALAVKDYGKAKSNYQEALGLKEAEKYPKDKIAEIEGIINASAKLEEDYKIAIKEGDRALLKEEYEPAKIAFEKALSLKAAEQHPKDKLAEIKNKLEELAAKKAAEEAAILAQKQLEEKYKALITSADNAFNGKDYEKAKTDYNAAILVKTDEKYPKDKLEEINKLLEELAAKKAADEAALLASKAVDEQYKGLIKIADGALINKNYDVAKENYNKALDVKKEEQYPKDKIAEIEAILAKIAKEKEDSNLAAEAERKKKEYYDALIAQADAELNGKNFDEAKSKYNQALGVIPDQKYPKDKLQEIADILAKLKAEKDNALMAQKEIDEQYKKLVQEGDVALGTEKYADAKEKYKTALNVKQNEQYPKDQLSKIEDILAEIARKDQEIKLTNNAQKQKQEEYDLMIKNADKELAGKRYETAKSSYESALSIIPDKTYPKEKIDEILRILAEIAAKEKNTKEMNAAEAEKRKSYEKLVADGDKFIGTKEYKKAQGKFNAALTLYPDEKYPSDKLAEILELMKEPVLVEVPNIVAVTTKPGERAKINDAQERAIEAKMAKMLNKKNIENDAALQKEKDNLKAQEEIRISASIDRTNEAGKELDRYEADIAAMKERGNKYHLENSKDLIATTKILEKAENERVKNADKRRNEADRDLEQYTKEQIKFEKEQEELSKDKMENHYVFVDVVTEAQNMMIERGEETRESNRKDIEKLIEDTKKNDERAKKRSLELELDVHKYRAELAKEEQVRVTSSIDRTAANKKEIDEMEKDLEDMKKEKANNYKLNVEALLAFKEKIKKLEEARIESGEKVRAENIKDIEKIKEDTKKNDERAKKRSLELELDVHQYRADLAKEELTLQKNADKKRNTQNELLLKEREKLGVPTQSQEERYKSFQVSLDEEKKSNDKLTERLQAHQTEKILLASAGLDDFYMGEKKPRQDDELIKKYSPGITEEVQEQGNSITIKRVKVTGDQVDVYERVLYTWGGTFFYKNGVNITQALWDKESIEK